MTEDKQQDEKDRCHCPYCDEDAEPSPYCQPCKITEFHCPRCHQAVPRGKRVCPHCGADIRKEAQAGG